MVSRKTRLAAALLAIAACPASAGLLEMGKRALKAIFPTPKAEAVDPAAYRGLTHLIVIGGGTRYPEPQETILNRVEDALRRSACWRVMGHADAKFERATLSKPSPRRWNNDAEVMSGLLSRLPKRDPRLGVLVLWVRDWRGNVYSRNTAGEAFDNWLGDRLKPKGAEPPRRGEYFRDAVAQVFDSQSGRQVWRGHMFFPSGTPLDERGRLPYAEQEVRDAQIRGEYERFIDFFAKNLVHPPNMQNGCTQQPNRPAASAASKASAPAAAAPPPDAYASLANPDPAVRAAAARSLGDEKDELALEPLIRALRDPEPKVRAYAADALGKMGRLEAVDPLLPLLADGSALIRTVVARSLGRIGGERAKPALQKRLSAEKEPVVREQIEIALKRIDDPMTAQMDPESMLPSGPPQ